MAEALFRQATAGRDDYQTSSAGIAASRGTSCNPETAGLLKQRGANLDGFSSRMVTPAILAEATHVFAMTQDHLDCLEDRFPAHAEKFYLMCEFVDIPGEGIGADVPDPIGMGRRAYEEVAGRFDRAIPTILDYIDRTWKSK
jgi:protein-tyrosine-phosphatase